MKNLEEVVYLGALLTKSHDTKKEITSRLAVCMYTWKQLDIFWKKSICPLKFKIHVYDAVIRSKLVYGLETIQIPKYLCNKLNTFQLKGLRKILGMRTTFIDRSNTNRRVLDVASRCVNPPKHPGKDVKIFSEYVSDKSQALLAHIIRSQPEDPMRQCTFEKDTNLPKIHINRRVGRPREQWASGAYK